MTKQCLIFVFLIFSSLSQAQSKIALQKYISNNLNYQHIKYKTGVKESQISIYQIEFKNCTILMAPSITIYLSDHSTEREKN